MTTDEFTDEYEKLYRWRTNWFTLAHQATLQLRQDRIVRRLRIADNNIGKLIDAFHQSDRTQNEATYCHPKDDNTPRWLLVFEDADVGPATYYDEQQALAAFALATISWNCHLFQSVKTQ